MYTRLIGAVVDINTNAFPETRKEAAFINYGHMIKPVIGPLRFKASCAHLIQQEQTLAGNELGSPVASLGKLNASHLTDAVYLQLLCRSTQLIA